MKEKLLVGTELRTLEVSFETSEEFRREYAANISNGGIFVETSEALSIQEKRSRSRKRYSSK